MRRLNLAILATVMLGATTAAWAADLPATTAPEPASLMAPVAPAPMSIDPLLSTLQPTCPAEPITSCNSCFYFGEYLSYQCWFFCDSTGAFRRVCHPCGSGCDL